MMNQYRQHGISMIEALIALVILSSGIIALAKLQSTTMSSEMLAKQASEALNLTEARLEALRHYTSISTTTDSYQNISSGIDNIAGINATFNRTWTVTEYTNPDYKSIAVNVSWTGIDGIARSTQLISHVGKIDPTSTGNIAQSSQAGSIVLP